MIATSVACRGLDVKDLVLVINFNCPNHLEDYVQRIGRTGRAGRKGTAYTFVTPEEAEYAPDIVKALTDAKQKVPSQLQALADQHTAAVKAGQAKKRRSGYKTTGGYKFDEEEDMEVKTLKKLRGKQLEVSAGVSDESELVEAVAALKKAREDKAKLKEKGKGKKASAEEEAAAEAKRKEEAERAKANTFVPPPNATPEQIVVLRAQWEASRRAKDLGNGGAAARLAPNLANLSGAERAKMLASRFSKAILPRPKSGAGGPVSEEKEMHFMEELEINDYPQQARWKATNRETINRVAEWYGAAVTNRGVYVAPGRKPGPGERKLHLVIEATSAVNLKKAKVRCWAVCGVHVAVYCNALYPLCVCSRTSLYGFLRKQQRPWGSTRPCMESTR